MKGGVMTRSWLESKTNYSRSMNTLTKPDFQDCVADAMAELSQFLGILHKQLDSQLPYDILTNLPAGIVQRDTIAKHTVRFAMVAALGEYLQWDTQQVTRLAAELLEDCNLHYLAGLLFEHCDTGGGDELSNLPAPQPRHPSES
jgi:hypothetical protein